MHAEASLRLFAAGDFSTWNGGRPVRDAHLLAVSETRSVEMQT